MKYVLLLSLAASAGLAAAGWALLRTPATDPEPVHVFDVYPGGDIQHALEEAAPMRGQRIVRIHAGTYRPKEPGQALVHFNARHDGIILEAVGDVTLTAANPGLADMKAPSYPAVVSHVVYFGDGISRRTVLRGFRITGANGFVQGPPDLKPIQTRDDLRRSVSYLSYEPVLIEPGEHLPKSHYFFTDGGAILVYGRSFPTIENVQMIGNYSSVCGAALSVQYHGSEPASDSVLCRNCVFRDNRTAISGPAADLLTRGSRATFENCLFAGNIANAKVDANGRSGYGALTVFPNCQAIVRHCTFTDNNAGVDDRGSGSQYTDTIFWNNRRPGETNHKPRFELDVLDARGVHGCFIHGQVNDLRGTISVKGNTFDTPDPDFDAAYCPRHPLFDAVGYRPAGQAETHE